MTLVALIIGVVLIVAAVRNTQGVLFSALASDVPAYMVWAAAIFAVGAVGFIPGLKPIARLLLGLVLLVIIMQNYQSILDGLSQPLGSASAKSVGDNSKVSGLGDIGHLTDNLGGIASIGSNLLSSFGGVK